jgi:hypothetical protein
MNEGEEDVDQPNVYCADEASKCGSDSFYMTSHCGPLYFEYINMIQL